MSFIRLQPCFNLCLNYITKRTHSNLTSSAFSKPTSANISTINSIILSNNKQQNEYKCPSKATFKIPLNDIKINDLLIKHELKLPQLRNQIELVDPLLHIEKSLPQSESINSNISYECNRPLFSVLKYRNRRMNRKKQKRYYQKMKYVIMKRDMRKQKRYEKVLELYKQIFEKRTQLFDPARMVNRELEKAKFFGYKVTDVYDKYREYLNTKMKTFDEKYFRKFDDIEYINFKDNKRNAKGQRMKMGFNYTKDGKLIIQQKNNIEKEFDPIKEALKNE